MSSKTINQPLISVVIPVFNAGKLIHRCLDSVLGSTLKSIEVICINDGSTDDSLTILNEYKNKDSRIQVLSQVRSFAGTARNAGIAIAKGLYIHFLDADDWIDVQAYEKWYKLAKDSDADVCTCMHFDVNNKTGKCVAARCDSYQKKSDKYFSITDIYKEPGYLINGVVVPWNKIYLRTFLIENNIRFDHLICANDRSFYFTVIYKAKKVATVREYWIYHAVNVPTSLCGSDIRLAIVNVINLFTMQKSTVKQVSHSARRKNRTTRQGQPLILAVLTNNGYAFSRAS